MIRIVSKENQGQGEFNGGQIVENKPIGFPQDGGEVRAFSNLFYWAHARANTDSTIGLHPHQGFEILSFILKGSIRHFDTGQNKWVPLNAGDVQIIRAGQGIQHSEQMHQGSAMFQIWLDPDLDKSLQRPASYSDYKAEVFPKSKSGDTEIITYIGENSPFELHTEGVEVVRMKWEGAPAVWSEALDKEKVYSIYIMQGAGSINERAFRLDDFIILKNENQLNILPAATTEIFMISSPAKLNYKTYAERMQARMAAG